MLKRMWKRSRRSQRGFTLIELMIVMTIIGILAAIAAPNYQWGIIKARESVLREDLYLLYSAIDQFNADQGKYPDTLEELTQKPNTNFPYLKKIPIDPFTKKDDWVTTPPPAGGSGDSQGQEIKGNVYEVHSASTLIGTNGKPYSEWTPWTQ